MQLVSSFVWHTHFVKQCLSFSFFFWLSFGILLSASDWEHPYQNLKHLPVT